MKKISFAICATLAFLSDVGAMNWAKEEQYNGKVPVRIYVVKTAPPIEIVQLPTQQQVILDNGIIAPSINIECNTYNDIQTKGKLSIKYDMNLEQMINAIRMFVGKDKDIEYIEGWLN